MAKPADYLLTKKNFFYELRDIIHLNGLSIRETVPDLEDSKYCYFSFLFFLKKKNILKVN